MTNPLKPPCTERLSFREWHPVDSEPFHAICTDPRVMQFVGDGEPWSREKTQQFIDRAVEMQQAHGFCQWPLIHKADSSLIGYCGFVMSDEAPEIGWRLARAYWGQGLATEAALAVLNHGLSTIGFERVIATVQTENAASIRVIEKLGMERETSFERDGKEVIVYAANGRDAHVD